MGFIVDDNEKGLHGECRRETFVIYDDFGKGFYVELEWNKLAELEFVIGKIREQGERQNCVEKRPQLHFKVENTPAGRLAGVARIVIATVGEEDALRTSTGELHQAVHEEIERRKRS